MCFYVKMDKLSDYIDELKKINNDLLYALSTKITDKDRDNCVNRIDAQCKLINPTNNNEKEQFVALIKRYITVQEDYKKNKLSFITTHLKLSNPNLTDEACVTMIRNGQYKNALCLYDVHSMHDYVTLRHKEILKLEQSIQEVKELFIATYALVYVQKEQVDNIAQRIDNAKNDVKIAKTDVTDAYKYKKSWK